jgi:hypothetical protein
MAWQFLGDNTLYWQPDTRVQTFPSGLVLVQRSAICRNTYLTTARGSITVGAALPCESPSTVTVFQFPQAQEIHEGNGFVRFDVSGYGKFNDGYEWENRFTWFEFFFAPRIFKQFVVSSDVNVNPFDYLPTQTIVLSSVFGTTVTLGTAWVVESGDVSGRFGKYNEYTASFIPGFTT